MTRTLLSRGLTPGQRDYLRRSGVDLADLARIKAEASAAPATQEEIDAIPLPGGDRELAEFYAASNAHTKTLFAHPENLARFTARYARAQQRDGGPVDQRQIDDAARTAVYAFMREASGDDKRFIDKMRADGVLNLSPAQQVQRKHAAAYNKRADGAKIDNEFDDATDFFSTIYWKNTTAAATEKRNRILNSFGSIIPADGGFLIPETLRAELLRVSLESSIMRSRARVIPMEALRVPIPMIDTTTNNGSVFGGMVAYWGEESAALTESQARFGRIILEANKLTGFAIVPNELISDSLISFTSLIDQLWPETISFFEDLGFIRGSGVGEPFGLIGANNLAAVAVAAQAGQPTATLLWENLVAMYARLLPASMGRAVWLASIDTFPQLATMALQVGTGGSAVWLNNGVQGPPMTILGRPVIFTEKMNTLGTRGDIGLYDLGYYLIGDRQSMSAESSKEYRFANDQTAFRIIERVTGRPWLQSAITPANGGNSLSPFVELATR